MLKIIRIVLQLSVIGAGAFALLSGNLAMAPLIMLLLGIFMIVSGFEQIKKDRKEFWGYAFVMISLFIFVVSWQGFLIGG